MSNNETRDIVPVSGETSLVRADDAGTMMLAAMSEAEFNSRLETLKRGRARIAIIQRELMEPDIDYGVIPGTPKPTLYKAGAEKLCDFYHYAADFTFERTACADGTAPTINYLSHCLLHLGSTAGPIIAVGQGSANSWERKHRYRSAERACPECGAMKTIIKGKDEYEKDPKFKGGWLCFAKKGGCGAKFVANDPQIVNQQLGEVENPDQWDLDNTLLKMSEKRSFVDATLRATATSGLFTQDVEDMPEFDRSRPRIEAPVGAPDGIAMASESARLQAAEMKAQQPTPPSAPPAASQLATPAQLKQIYLTATRDLKITEEALEQRCQAQYGRLPLHLTKREASEFIEALKSGGIAPAAEAAAPAPGARDLMVNWFHDQAVKQDPTPLDPTVFAERTHALRDALLTGLHLDTSQVRAIVMALTGSKAGAIGDLSVQELIVLEKMILNGTAEHLLVLVQEAGA